MGLVATSVRGGNDPQKGSPSGVGGTAARPSHVGENKAWNRFPFKPNNLAAVQGASGVSEEGKQRMTQGSPDPYPMPQEN